MEKQLIIGIIAGCLTAISAIPQIIKVLQTKEVKHISPVMFMILAIGNATWCWYGSLLKDWPIIITNAFSFTMALTMLLLKLIYNKR
ncbi:MAG: SemiSWEET transporter [Pedobacter sp.]|uniref:SemiSWEET family sugar transporter n=1 Tax=Pedobacter sp. TaxID=1411316 RepID=UPI0028070BE8|nr:SemiSWEET transporter [Pedobacter sp.]MDQ8005404.1 SemiSWEET transporter [Pedobacter sp.]